MEMMLGFIAGLFVATLIGLVTTTTPDQAKSNLRKWGQKLGQRLGSENPE